MGKTKAVAQHDVYTNALLTVWLGFLARERERLGCEGPLPKPEYKRLHSVFFGGADAFGLLVRHIQRDHEDQATRDRLISDLATYAEEKGKE